MTPAPANRPSDSAEDARVARTRADVARAALEVLTAEGSEAVTHARVAEIAKYSKTTLYTHWPARIDLITMAIEALGEMPHHQRTGELRADVIAELKVFRKGVLDLRLDRVLASMAQWASDRADATDSGQGKHRWPAPDVCDARRGASRARRWTRPSPCSPVSSRALSLMFGTLPDDDIIAAAVDIVLKSASPAR